MEEILLNKKEKLRREIEVAQGLLKQNLEEANLKNYLSVGSSLIPGMLSGLFSDSAKPFAKSEVLNSSLGTTKQKFGSILQVFSMIFNAIKSMRNR